MTFLSIGIVKRKIIIIIKILQYINRVFKLRFLMKKKNSLFNLLFIFITVGFVPNHKFPPITVKLKCNN